MLYSRFPLLPVKLEALQLVFGELFSEALFSSWEFSVFCVYPLRSFLSYKLLLANGIEGFHSVLSTLVQAARTF